MIATTKSPKLTVLSFGAGQDSTAILLALVFDAKFRKRYAPKDLVVVFSDTGDEHPMTYLHLVRIDKFCKKHNVPFFHLTPSMGFHTKTWHDLRAQYKRNNCVGSKAFPKTCTVNLKINPIYKFLNWYVSQQYEYHQYGSYDIGGTLHSKHYAIVCFEEDHGKIDMLIGIAKGEEKRIDKSGKANNLGRWFTRTINRIYPLVDVGWDRQECQNRIKEYDVMPVPVPSNCMLCPFMSKIELLWLFRHHPDDFHAWVEFEANKLKKFAHKGDKNVGVFGDLRTLTDILAEAEAEFGKWTKVQLSEYKMSHGHCVMSKY